MADITSIHLRLTTGTQFDSESDPDVYLGIGGREFYVDSEDEDYNDFEWGDDRVYVFGEYPSLIPTTPPYTKVFKPYANDPRKPYFLKTENLDLFPVYIRYHYHPGDAIQHFHKDDYWLLEFVNIVVNPDTDNIIYSALGGDERLWFGRYWGNILYIPRTRG